MEAIANSTNNSWEYLFSGQAKNNSTSDSLNATSWNALFQESIKGTAFETPMPLFQCYQNPKGCALELGKYVAYEVPKVAFENSWSTCHWTVAQALLKADAIVKSAFQSLGVKSPPELYQFGARGYQGVANRVNEWACKASLWAVSNSENSPKKIEIGDAFNPDSAVQVKAAPIKSDYGSKNCVDLASSTTESRFNVLDLIGPAMFMGMAANKAVENGKSTLFTLYLILSGKRMITTTYKTTPKDWTMSQAGQYNVMNTRHYSTFKLFKDFCVEGLFTALWAGAGYLSFQGIEESLISGGSSEAKARMLTKSLLVALTTAPMLYGFGKACFESEKGLEGPMSASHFAYSNPSDFIPQENPQAKDEDSISGNRANPLNLLTNSQSRFFTPTVW